MSLSVFRNITVIAFVTAILVFITSAPRHNAEKSRWDEYITLADEAYRAADFKEAERLLDLAITDAKNCNNQTEHTTALIRLADIYYMLAKFDDEKAVIHKAMEICNMMPTKDTSVMAETLCAMGNYLINQGNVSEGTCYIDQAYAIVENGTPVKHEVVVNILCSTASRLIDRAEYEKAEGLIDRAIEIQKQNGVKGFRLTSPNQLLGRIRFDQGEIELAETLCKQRMAIQEADLNCTHPLIARSLSDLASLLMTKEPGSEHHELVDQAADKCTQSIGANHPTTSKYRCESALYQTIHNRHQSAKECLERELSLQENYLRQNHPLVIYTKGHLADIYAQEGMNTEAQTLFKEIVAFKRESFGTSSTQYADAKRVFARFLTNQGDLNQSENHLKEALEITSQSQNKNTPCHAQVLRDYGHLCLARQRADEAITCFEKALPLFEALYGKDHLYVSPIVGGLGLAYYYNNDNAAAETLFKRALDINLKTLGPNNVNTATTMNNLGLVKLAQGKPGAAETLFTQVLKIKKEIVGENDQSIATVTVNLAGVLQCQGKYEQAKDLYKKAINIFTATVEEKHPHIGSAFHNLGEIYEIQHEYSQASECYEKAANIYEYAFGHEHPKLMRTLFRLGVSSAYDEDWDQAIHSLERALSISKVAYGQSHNETKAILESLVAVLKDAGEQKKADEFNQELEKLNEEIGKR